MKVIKNIFLSFFLTIILQACEQRQHGPINDDDQVPFQVENPNVINLPGAAEIIYTLPQDLQGLLYVKALCEIRPGIIREVKSSYYEASLVIDGFSDTIEYEVNLISVGRNGLESDPVKVIVNPLTPPIWDVYNTISMNEGWGGISFTFENTNEANIVFEVCTLDSLGEWIPVENFYTKRMNATFSIRGFEPEKRKFGIAVRDRWLNRTDTLTGEFTPWYEAPLNPSLYRHIVLPTDYTVNHTANASIPNLWSGNHTIGGWLSRPDLDGSLGGGMPQWFTVDLGVTAVISRLVLFYRTGSILYQSGCPDEFEIWGSYNPNPDGSWDESWVLLKEGKAVKPSGLPHGQTSQEDVEYAASGDEFIFENSKPVRYIRFKFLSNQAKTSHVDFVQFYLYGQLIE